VPVAPPAETSAPTEERIVHAAEACLRGFGLRRFSIAAVADHAQVSRGSVYRYFADRNALLDAVLLRVARRFVARSEPAVRTRRTLATQVAEAAAFICEHMHDPSLTLALSPGEETLLSILITARIDALVEECVDFWQPYLAAAHERGEIRADLDDRLTAEWIVRIMLSFALMPSATVDLRDGDAVRRFVHQHIVKGLAP
jgi:AcrR family transcriptional regulator